MIDLAWMLSSLFSGAFITLIAVDATNRPAIGLVIALVSGWAAAQRDHNYKRVRSERHG